MTRAPASLQAVRTLLLTHLDVDPKTSRPQDLEPAEVGIVGDPNHRGGYHCGSDRVDADDYSVRESGRDRSGLTLDASGLDVGEFSVKSGGRTHTLQTFSVWCAQQCAAGMADTRDIREIIYSPDGKTVKRWDRLGKRSTGDSSHLWHTHFSFFRDSTKAGRDQTPLFRRYLTEIGLIKSEDIMASIDELRQVIRQELAQVGPAVIATDQVPAARPPYANSDYGDPANAKVGNKFWSLGYALQTITEKGRATAAEVAAIRAELADMAGRDLVDAPEIVAGVLAGLSPQRLAEALTAAGLTPEAIAAAVPPDMARQVVDELSARLAAQG